MKTIKQLADEMGVSKQKVYRYIKKHCISEAHHESGVMYYDDAVAIELLQYFSKNNRINEAHRTVSNDTAVDAVILMLQSELATKNAQLAEKDMQISVLHKLHDQQQQLHAAAMQKLMLNEPTESQNISLDGSKREGHLDECLRYFKDRKTHNKVFGRGHQPVSTEVKLLVDHIVEEVRGETVEEMAKEFSRLSTWQRLTFRER